MRKTCELIIADETTINGRVYSREQMQRICDESNRRTTLIGSNFDRGIRLSLADVVGTARDFTLSEDGKISAEIDIFPHLVHMHEWLVDLFDLSPMLYGSVKDDGTVDDMTLAYWALTLKER